MYKANLLITLLLSACMLYGQEEKRGSVWESKTTNVSEYSTQLADNITADSQPNLISLVKGFGYASVEPQLVHRPLELDGEREGIVTPYIKMPFGHPFTIQGIECVVAEDLPEARITISRLEGEETSQARQVVVVSQKCSLVKGYNRIILDKPLSVSKEDRLIAGYSCRISKKSGKWSTPVLFDGDTHAIPEANQVMFSDEYYEPDKTYNLHPVMNTQSFNVGSLLIYVLIGDDPDGAFDYLLYPLEQPENIILTKPDYFVYRLCLRGLGLKDVSTVDFTERYYNGYDLKTSEHRFEIDVPVKGFCEVRWNHPPYPQGTSKGVVSMARINDYALGQFSPAHWYFDAFMPSKGGSLSRNTILLETFGTENMDFLPIDHIEADLRNQGYNVSRIVYPIEDAQSPGRPLLSALRGQEQIDPSSLPTLAINRAPYLGNNEYPAFVLPSRLLPGGHYDSHALDPFIEEHERVVIKQIQVSDSKSGKISVKLSGKLLFDADPDDLYATIVVTENKAHATGLMKAMFTSPTGEKIMPEADGSFEYNSVELAIDPSWQREQLQVVTILHRNPNYKGKISCHAYSCRTLPLGGSFNDVDIPYNTTEKLPELYQDAEGFLNARGTYDSVVVRTMDGRMISNSLPCFVSDGVYVVSFTSPKGDATNSVKFIASH